MTNFLSNEYQYLNALIHIRANLRINDVAEALRIADEVLQETDEAFRDDL